MDVQSRRYSLDSAFERSGSTIALMAAPSSGECADGDQIGDGADVHVRHAAGAIAEPLSSALEEIPRRRPAPTVPIRFLVRVRTEGALSEFKPLPLVCVELLAEVVRARDRRTTACFRSS